QYSTLSKTTIIQPSTAQADIRVDLACNHHVICYCAMIDYDYTKQAHLVPKDHPLWACVIGPHRMTVNTEVAMALAVLVSRLGIARQIVDLLRDGQALISTSQARETQA